MKRRIGVFILGLGISLAAIPPWAQQPQQSQQAKPPSPGQSQSENQQAAQPGVLRTQSDLVRLDVEVTDKSGNSIKGLHADQFVVTDDGKPQKISIFSYADIEKLQTAGAEDAKPIVIAVDNSGPSAASGETLGEQIRDRRMIVLFFDMTSMQTDDILRAHDAAEKYVEKQIQPADLVAVVTFSTRVRILANFTNDRDVLKKAIAKLTPGSESELGSPLYAAAQNGEYSVQEYTGAAYTADETEFNVFNTDQKLAAVEGLANVLGGIPGRKAMVEFTGGITQTGEENRTALRAATDAANRANVSIYSIDTRGLFAVAPGGDVTTNAATVTSMFTGASVFHQTDQREDSRDTLATLSSDTGGKAFFDLGDLSDAIPQIQQDNGGYYLIGYYLAAGVKRDGRWHSLHVKVNASGAHVRFRAGYYAPKDFQHLEKEGRDQQLADAIHSDNPVVELPVAVETSFFRLSPQQVYVPIAAKISSSALDWAQKHGRREAEFDFAAEVKAAPGGQVVAQLRDTIRVQLDTERFQQVQQSNLLYQGGIVLAPGKYHLKFVARENESGRIGTFEQYLVIPEARKNHLELSSVLLSSQLVAVEKSSEVQVKGQGMQARLAASPLEMAGEKIIPSVTRFFTQGQTLYIFFQAYYPEKNSKSGQASQGDGFDPNSLRAGLIFFRSGVQVNATPLLSPTEVNAKSRTASFRISLPLSRLPGGRYTVQAVVIAAGTQESAFGRAYLALQQAAPPTQVSTAPSGATAPAPAKPPSP